MFLIPDNPRSHSRSWIPRWLVSYGLVPAIVRLNEISAHSAGWVAVPDCAQNQSLAILTSSICTVAARTSPARPSLGSCGEGSNGGRMGSYTGLLQYDWNQLRLSDWRMCWRSSGKYSARPLPLDPATPMWSPVPNTPVPGLAGTDWAIQPSFARRLRSQPPRRYSR